MQPFIPEDCLCALSYTESVLLDPFADDFVLGKRVLSGPLHAWPAFVQATGSWTRCAPAPTTNAGKRPAALLGDERPARDKDDSRRYFHCKQAVACLQEWLHANIRYPYPSLEIKRALARTSGLTESQVDHWYNNARKRLLRAQKNKQKNLHPCRQQKIAPMAFLNSCHTE